MKPSAIAAVILALSVLCAPAADLEAYSRTVASLISPKQLATLGKRGANPRLQKAVAYIAEARTEKLDVDGFLFRLSRLVGAGVETDAHRAGFHVAPAGKRAPAF